MYMKYQHLQLILLKQFFVNINFKNLQSHYFFQSIRARKGISVYLPIILCINQLWNNSTVTSQSNRSIANTSMLITIPTTIPALSRRSLFPPNIAATYSLCYTKNNSFQTNTTLNATGNRSQTFYHSGTTPNVRPFPHFNGPTSNLPSSGSIPTVIALNDPSINTQKYLVPLVAKNKSKKTFDGLDCQYTLENIGTKKVHIWVFNSLYQPLDPVVCFQRHKIWHNNQVFLMKLLQDNFYYSLKVRKKIGWLLYLLLKKILVTKNCVLHSSWSSSFRRRHWKCTHLCSES